MNDLKIDIDLLTGEKPLPDPGPANGQGSMPFEGNQAADETSSKGAGNVTNGQKQPENEYVTKFKASILDQGKEYPAPEAAINIIQQNNTIPLLTLKSFSLWQGKQKSKKTTILALAVATYITENSGSIDRRFDTYLKAAFTGKVLVIDTEQGESYAARTMKLILKLADLTTSPNLIYCDLREFTPQERRKIISAAIESTSDVRLVIIDGLVDLLDDFMDARDGHNAMTEILCLCSKFNIHIAGVLHQNKADKNARAHIGTIASQKCEIEISTEVDPDDRNQSLVTCVNSRGLPFDQFAIRWDRGSLPRINNEWHVSDAATQKASRNYVQSSLAALRIFKPLSSLTYTEAIEAIMADVKKSEATAKRLLKEFLTWGFINKGDDGKYRINPVSEVRDHEGSKEGS